VRLPEGEDFLLAPVLRGMIGYELLLDGTVTLWDLALMNDAIAVQQENERRAYERAEEERRG